MSNPDIVDVVLVVCPRCQVRGSRGVLGRVVRNQQGRYQFVSAQTPSAADEGQFRDDQLLRAAEFVTFVFENEAAGKGSPLEVECKHGRRSVQRSRLDREIAAHAPGKPARILVSEPPAH